MALIDKIKVIQRRLVADQRGWFLKVIDGNEENLPSSTGEIYITNAIPGQAKGGHYHPKASEWFTLLTGSCHLFLIDVLTKDEMTISLSADDPKTIYVPNGIAHIFVNNAETDFILLAYTDRLYDPEDTVPYHF